MDTTFNNIAIRIIKEQELIIGPLAQEEAKKVSGLKVGDFKRGEVSLEGDQKLIIDKLVAQYERLFGKASHEACKTAVASIIADMPQDQVPSSLKA